jgi:hypothetical protein
MALDVSRVSSRGVYSPSQKLWAWCARGGGVGGERGDEPELEVDQVDLVRPA